MIIYTLSTIHRLLIKQLKGRQFIHSIAGKALLNIAAKDRIWKITIIWFQNTFGASVLYLSYYSVNSRVLKM